MLHISFIISSVQFSLTSLCTVPATQKRRKKDKKEKSWNTFVHLSLDIQNASSLSKCVSVDNRLKNCAKLATDQNQLFRTTALPQDGRYFPPISYTLIYKNLLLISFLLEDHLLAVLLLLYLQRIIRFRGTSVHQASKKPHIYIYIYTQRLSWANKLQKTKK